MSFLYSILAFAIVLGIIVLVHEFGHYIAARLMGVRVETFSFGFGKRLFGKKVGDTDFRLSLIPLGGYIKMAGEEEWDPENLKPYEFQAKNRGQKIFILFMGPAMNLLLSFFIFTAINITGVETAVYKNEPPLIGYVEKGSPAEEAGIQKGDLIRSVDGQAIKDWKTLQITIVTNPDQELPVEFEREGKLQKTTISTGSFTRYNMGDAGIHWGPKTELNSVIDKFPAFKAGLKQGDILLAVDQKPVNYFELAEMIAANAEKPLMFKVKRGEEHLDVKITPRKVYFLESDGMTELKEAKKKLEETKNALPELTFGINHRYRKYRIVSRDIDSPARAQNYVKMSASAITFDIKEKGVVGIDMMPHVITIKTSYGLFPAMGKSVDDIVNLTVLVFNSLKKMIVGKLSPKNLSGPIEIAKFSQKAMESGPSNFFMLIAFISLQLGLINLFPIPALDGGHLMIFSIETVIRKDFSQKVKNLLMNLGFLILIALMGFVILNDIAKTLPNGWNSLWPF